MGAFKLGNMTFGSLFKKPETVLYPIETKPHPTGLKGHIAIDVNDCILCGMCERSCPTSCITVDKASGFWETNRYSCIQCGYCITVCPKKCLHMEPTYAPAATEKAKDRFDVPKQERSAKKKAEKPAKDKQSAAAESKAKDAASAQAASPSKSANNVSAKFASGMVRDEALEGKLAMMDADKAAKVRKAIEERA